MGEVTDYMTLNKLVYIWAREPESHENTLACGQFPIKSMSNTFTMEPGKN